MIILNNSTKLRKVTKLVLKAYEYMNSDQGFNTKGFNVEINVVPADVLEFEYVGTRKKIMRAFGVCMTKEKSKRVFITVVGEPIPEISLDDFTDNIFLQNLFHEMIHFTQFRDGVAQHHRGMESQVKKRIADFKAWKN